MLWAQEGCLSTRIQVPKVNGTERTLLILIRTGGGSRLGRNVNTCQCQED